MKNSTNIFLFLALVAISNIYAECAAPSPVSVDEPIVVLHGKWKTYSFYQNGVDVTEQYQMSLDFDGQGQCVQTLAKPDTTLTYTLQYVVNEEGTRVKIDSANIIIDSHLGNFMRLVYLDGPQPPGFIEPWIVEFKLIN